MMSLRTSPRLVWQSVLFVAPSATHPEGVYMSQGYTQAFGLQGDADSHASVRTGSE